MPMRTTITALSVTALVFATGCSNWGGAGKGIGPIGSGAPRPTPEPADLVRYMNREAAKVRTLSCQDLDIDVKDKGILVPTVHGNMMCQKPRNFRLTGKAAGSPQLDFGSNDDQFWFWVKQGAPYLFHCKYTEFEKGVDMPFPFQPEWVVQALGMAEYGDVANYRVESKGNTIDLIEDSVLQGKPIKKITKFNADVVAAPKSQVLGYSMVDAAGKVICTATVNEVRQVQTADGEWATYPRKVMLDWPQDQVRLELTLDKVTLNQVLPAEQSARLFTRPNWPSIQNYDLARRVQVSPSSRVQPAGGYSQR